MLAIVFVLVHHWILNYLYKFIPGQIHFFTLLGYYGVEFFFVLSGFLIGNIIIKLYVKDAFSNFKNVFNFWSRRWLRTLPLYYMVLCGYILMFIIKHAKMVNLVHYFFFVQNFFRYHDNNYFFPISWSLSVEEWFYLSVPIVLVCLNFVFNRWIDKKNLLLIVIASFLAFGLVMRIYYAFNYNNISWNYNFRKAVICREDSVAFGILGAFLFNFYKQHFFAYKKLLMYGGVLILIGCAVIFCTNVAYNYYYNAGGNVSFFSKTFLFSLVDAAVLLMLPFFYLIKTRIKLLKAFVEHISKISYSLYLLHEVSFKVTNKILPVTDSAFTLIISFLLCMGISIAVSSLSYRFIEQYFLKLRDKPQAVTQ
jgi:peptidoglycan/LPS O-acetylase OafA/YrhL